MQNKDTNVFDRDSTSVNRKDKHTTRVAISIIAFTAISFVMRYFSLKIPFMPSFISIEFSVFPELIATIAYGPIIGATVCLLKTAIHIGIVETALISDISSLLVELVFVLTAGIYYRNTILGTRKRKNKSKNKSNIHRRTAIIKGGFLGIIPALIIQFLMANFFVFPMFDKYYGKYGYSFDKMLLAFNDALHRISSNAPQLKAMWQGILAINIPLSFIKLTLVVLITALIYPAISPYLHFKKHSK